VDLRLGVEGILGIRFAPCMPSRWSRAEVRIRGPAGSLLVSIEESEGVGAGVVNLEIDGEQVPGDVARFPEDGNDREVVVRLGRRDRAVD